MHINTSFSFQGKIKTQNKVMFDNTLSIAVGKKIYEIYISSNRKNKAYSSAGI